MFSNDPIHLSEGNISWTLTNFIVSKNIYVILYFPIISIRYLKKKLLSLIIYFSAVSIPTHFKETQ